MATRTRLGRALAVLSLLLGVQVLAACAANTPLCSTAAGLLEGGQLAGAAEVYAHAAQVGEGSCADDGLTAVGERYSLAHRAAAAGFDAELSGDATTAVAQYTEARRLDVGNEPAAQGLLRLGREVPGGDVVVAVRPAPGPGGVAWPWVAAVAAVLGALILGAALYFSRRLRHVEHRATGSDRGLALAAGTPPRALRARAAEHTANADDAGARELAENLKRLREEVERQKHRLGLIAGKVHDFSTDQLRLLSWISGRIEADDVPTQGPRTLAHWPDARMENDVVVSEDDEPADQLRILVVASRPRASADDEQFVVHTFRLEAVRIELADLLDDHAVLEALTALADEPEEPEELARAAGAHGIESCGWRVVRAVEVGALTPPQTEAAFWRSWHGTVLVEWTRRITMTTWCTDLCSIAHPSVTSSLAEPSLLLALRGRTACRDEDERPPDLAPLLRTELEETLLSAMIDRPPPQVLPAPRGSLVCLDKANGVTQRPIAEILVDALPLAEELDDDEAEASATSSDVR